MYQKWTGIIKRCENPNSDDFKNYGGRGIKICSHIRSDYLNFKKYAIENGYKKGLTVDRKSVNGHYSCGECKECIKNNWGKNIRFVGMNVQAANKRKPITNTSGYVGVSFLKCCKKWESYLAYKGKRVRISLLKDKHKAAIERDKYILENNLPHTLNILKRKNA